MHKEVPEGWLLFVQCPLEGLIERKSMANLDLWILEEINGPEDVTRKSLGGLTTVNLCGVRIPQLTMGNFVAWVYTT